MGRIRIDPTVVLLGAGVIASALWATVSGRGSENAIDMGEIVAVVAAAMLHELGHMTAAWGWGVTIRSLRLDLFGARLELGGLTGYAAELAVAAGGPLVSLGMAALFWPMGGMWTGAELFSSVSLGLGLLNLLPVRGLDGGRMLSCVLSLTAGEGVSESVLRLTTGIALGCLWLLSVYTLLRVGEALTLFTFTLCLLLRLTGYQK